MVRSVVPCGGRIRLACTHAQRHTLRVRTFARCLILVVGCASTEDADVAGPSPVTDTSGQDPSYGDPVYGDGDRSSKDEGNAANDGGRMTTGRDSGSSSSSRRDAGQTVEAGPPQNTGACGICDRDWTCNGFAQYWATESDGRCVNQVNRTGLRCDGTLDGSTVRNVGTWQKTSGGFVMNFASLGGGTHVIRCQDQ